MISLFGIGMAFIWFCSIVAVESILLLILIENDKPGWCTVSMLSAFGLLKVLAGVNVFSEAWHHPGITALVILGYFAIGTVWSIGKWYLFVKDRRTKYDEAKAEWDAGQREVYDNLSINSNKGWTGSHKYKAFLNRNGGLAPLVRDNKSRVLTWMGYWPWSMLWTVINDPIKRAFKAIYNRIHNMLQSISNNAFKDVQ